MPSRSSRATGRTRPRDALGNRSHTGAGASRYLGRRHRRRRVGARPAWPLATWWPKPVAMQARTRSSTVPGYGALLGCNGQASRPRRLQRSWTGLQLSSRRRHRQHRPAPDSAARGHGCGHRGGGFAQPDSRLDALAESLAARATKLVWVAADAADEASMTAVFERFGADLPPLGGIYLAAFGGGPITLSDMTDDDVTAMFSAEAGCGCGAAQAVVDDTSAPVRVVLLDLGPFGFAVAGALRRYDHVPGHVRLRTARRGVAGHDDQLGLMEIVGGQPERAGAPDYPRFRTRTDA